MSASYCHTQGVCEDLEACMHVGCSATCMNEYIYFSECEPPEKAHMGKHVRFMHKEDAARPRNVCMIIVRTPLHLLNATHL